MNEWMKARNLQCCRFMYWTDINNHSPAVERAHMDGTNRMVLFSRGLETPTNVAVDPLTGKVYWAEFDDENTESDILCHVEGSQPIGLGLQRPGEGAS